MNWLIWTFFPQYQLVHNASGVMRLAHNVE